MFLRFKLLFVAIFISFYSFSQTGWTESIYLKSGNVVRGVIVENVPDKSVKIKTSDGSLFFFTLDEIEKITKTENTVTSNATVTDSYVPPKRFKYTKTGLSKEIRFGLFTPSCVQASFVLGYMPVSRWNIGLGISINNYTSLGIANNSASYKQVGESSENSVFMPITIENTYFLTQCRASFYFFMDFGYAPLMSSSTGTYRQDFGYGSFNDDYTFTSKAIQGGQYFCTGIGVRIAVNEKITIKSDLGILGQRYVAEQTNTYYSDTMNNSNSAYFPISFGFRTAILF